MTSVTNKPTISELLERLRCIHKKINHHSMLNISSDELTILAAEGKAISDRLRRIELELGVFLLVEATTHTLNQYLYHE